MFVLCMITQLFGFYQKVNELPIRRNTNLAEGNTFTEPKSFVCWVHKNSNEVRHGMKVLIFYPDINGVSFVIFWNDEATSKDVISLAEKADHPKGVMLAYEWPLKYPKNPRPYGMYLPYEVHTRSEFYLEWFTQKLNSNLLDAAKRLKWE